MSITKKTDRMDIFIEEEQNSILVQEKWQYLWHTKVTPWLLSEKRHFHKLADLRIWSVWSGYFKLKVTGSSNFATKHKSTSFTLNFDIKWVLKNPHWNVTVTKIAPNTFEQSYIKWNERVIHLDTEDTKLNFKGKVNSKSFYQYPIAHEFGHTVGNSYFALIGKTAIHSDEYSLNNLLNGGFKLDYSSIMNIGNELRNRHLDYILIQLNSMIPNTYFIIA
ncbi:hypothetical protein O2K51_08490 [Apibacter raozihei]|uniref:hypothetical protein n=1 Tax=Apibacter TaxID=1778601 RepID=UPI000FE40C96|nr:MULTISPECIES: hypothetical protein [Apibacter]